MTTLEAEAVARGHAQPLKAALLVALAGPPIGSLVVVFPGLISLVFEPWGGEQPSSVEAILGVAGFLLLAVVFSYVLGGVPALLAAGMVYWLVRTRGRLTYAQSLAIAAVVGLAFALVLSLDLDRLAVITVPSLCGAIVCRGLIGRFRWIAPADEAGH